MQLRKLHRIVGAVFAPFFLLTATTGLILLWRNAELYSLEVKGTLLGLHNWEGLAPYIGVILAAGLLFMTTTGLAIMLGIYKRKRKQSPSRY